MPALTSAQNPLTDVAAATASAPTATSSAAPAATSPANAGGSPTAADDKDEHVLVIRALVSMKDAGIIIGKGGSVIDDIRTQARVDAGVTPIVPGVNERILTVKADKGDDKAERVANAFVRILGQPTLSSNTSSFTPVGPANNAVARLLISHNLMGAVIGSDGGSIKAIQSSAKVHMVAHKQMLPQSTERVVEIHGSPEAIGEAIRQVGTRLLDDWEHGLGTVLYQPGAGGIEIPPAMGGLNNRRASLAAFNPIGAAPNILQPQPYGDFGRRLSMMPAGAVAPSGGKPTAGVGAGRGAGRRHSTLGTLPAEPGKNEPAKATQVITIPSDMVGCIIGKDGAKITAIRQKLGCQITIAPGPHDETGERKFTIHGTAEAREKVLFWLYGELESEKQRRVNKELHHAQEALRAGGGAGNGIGPKDIGPKDDTFTPNFSMAVGPKGEAHPATFQDIPPAA